MSANYEQMTDAELSEAVAVQFLQWKPYTYCNRWKQWRNEFGLDVESPRFAKSADAVLPLVEKLYGSFTISRFNRKYSNKTPKIPFYIVTLPGDIGLYTGEPTTIARAACIALLRAKYAENLTKNA